MLTLKTQPARLTYKHKVRLLAHYPHNAHTHTRKHTHTIHNPTQALLHLLVSEYLINTSSNINLTSQSVISSAETVMSACFIPHINYRLMVQKCLEIHHPELRPLLNAAQTEKYTY